MQLTESQQAVMGLPLNASIFLEGPAGSGKTTAAVARLMHWLELGTPGEAILLLVPQRTLAAPYESALRSPQAVAGGYIQALTVGGLAQRMIDLFWPMIAAQAGFADPYSPPTFLTLETAQYYMAHCLRPLLDEGLFDSVNITRNRLYSQLLDNLNKAAVVGFPLSEVGQRLKSAWVGEPGQLRVYDDVQTAVDLFRRFCLEHNFLDFSLQIEVFRQHLWPLEACRSHLFSTYRHLIYDNVEEDTPIAHDLIREWLPQFDSALLIYDWDGGYRRFLGADPESGYALKELCDSSIQFETPLVAAPQVQSLARRLSKALSPRRAQVGEDEQNASVAFEAVEFDLHLFFPQMLDWVCERIEQLVHGEGYPASEIVVLAPFLSDALRFSLTERLAALNIPTRSHRPSRALREEPAVHCLLTLAVLAHPEWGILPTKFDVAYAFMQAFEGLDLVRAQLLAEIVYRQKDGLPALSSFEAIRPEVQERITFLIGERYERLRRWLTRTAERNDEFDHFLSRLFGEVLSQPGFGFHTSLDAGRAAAGLIESARKFRWVAGATFDSSGAPLGKEYLLMVQEGLIAAQYLPAWQTPTQEAVLLAPAYTFLMSNQPVEVQFWLDIGSRAWSERLSQPLTHPYVLSRAWPPGRLWTDIDEQAAEEESLYRLVLGLLRRCRRKIYLGLSEYNEQGFEQRGRLLTVFQRALQSAQAAEKRSG
jgi:hypothetical protein